MNNLFEEIVITTYQPTQQVVIGALAQRDVPHVAHHDVLSQLGAAVEHDVLAGPPVQLLDRAQKLDRVADVRDPLDRLHVECLVAGPQALVDLLEPQEA